MATGSTSTTANVGLLATPPAAPSFGHLINIKLKGDNYLLWRAQIIPYLRGQQLLGYVDGSIAVPPNMITLMTESGATRVPNPAYQQWLQQDQLLLSTLLSSLAPEVLSQVLFLTSSAEVWTTLEQMFASQSRARTMQIRRQLAMVRKKDQSVTDYYNKVKGLADSLAAAGQPLREDEIIAYMMGGLDAEYDSLFTAVATRAESIGLSDFYAHLLSFEMRLDLNNDQLQIPGASVNQVSRNTRNAGRTRGRGRGRGRERQEGQRLVPNNASSPRPVCQVCNKPGHTALRCYHRYDHSYQVDDNRASVNLATTPSYAVDNSWYTDTGATDHITGELDRLTVKERYHGKEQVQAANGAGSSHEENTSSRPM